MARRGAFVLAALPVGIWAALAAGAEPQAGIVIGLGLFGIAFAINSAVHSYLILAYSDADKAALNVGFYYMANAAGRLVGSLLSGLSYQLGGLGACLATASVFVLASALIALGLPKTRPPPVGDRLTVEP